MNVVRVVRKGVRVLEDPRQLARGELARGLRRYEGEALTLGLASRDRGRRCNSRARVGKSSALSSWPPHRFGRTAIERRRRRRKVQDTQAFGRSRGEKGKFQFTAGAHHSPAWGQLRIAFPWPDDVFDSLFPAPAAANPRALRLGSNGGWSISVQLLSMQPYLTQSSGLRLSPSVS